jgi:hypothetical protein
MRRFPLALAALALLLAPPARALAWNYVGHMAVDKLAYDQMDKGLKDRLAALLKAHPHYEAFLSKDRPDGVAENEWAFLRAGTWPDWVRSRHEGVEPEPTTFHKGPDHYINFPLIRPADKALFDERALQPDVEKDNILAALEAHTKILGSATEKDEKKAVSLCWLLHLVGDLHQPLHCVSLFSADFKDKPGDAGGNFCAVMVDGRVQRLHAYWDNLLGEAPAEADDAKQQAKVYKLVSEAVEQLHDPQYKREKFADDLKKTKFSEWAAEGVEKARTVAYLNGELKYAVAGRYPAKLPDDAPKVPENYAKDATALARQRVALAAYRLADALKNLPAKP